MTVKELYEYALEHGYEDFSIMVAADKDVIPDCFDVDEKHKRVILY